MSGFNRATLIGHLGKDPEVRRLNNGAPVVSFSLATSESWRDKRSGERVEKTEWHQVVIYNENLCKVAEQYVHKGSKVFLEGKIRTRKWQDRDGKDRFTTEIVLEAFFGTLQLLDRREDGGAAPASAASSSGASTSRTPGSDRAVASATVDTTKSYADQLDDEIPF